MNGGTAHHERLYSSRRALFTRNGPNSPRTALLAMNGEDGRFANRPYDVSVMVWIPACAGMTVYRGAVGTNASPEHVRVLDTFVLLPYARIWIKALSGTSNLGRASPESRRLVRVRRRNPEANGPGSCGPKGLAE